MVAEPWIFGAVAVGLGALMVCPGMPGEVVGVAACLELFSIGLFVGRRSK